MTRLTKSAFFLPLLLFSAGVLFTDSPAGRADPIGFSCLSSEFSSPSTFASTSGSSGNNGWFRGSVTITLSASSPSLGIASIYYSVDEGPLKAYYVPFLITTDGKHLVEYWSVDMAGDVEETQILHVNIESRPPQLIFGTPTPAPNYCGWSKTPIDVPYQISNCASGLESASAFSPVRIAAEGKWVTTTVRVVDNAGNSVTRTTPAVSIDLNPPVTSASTDGTTVTLTATDDLSGVAATYYRIDDSDIRTYSMKFSVIDSGSHVVRYWSVDRAGNIESAHSLAIDIDPTLAGLIVNPGVISAGGSTMATILLTGNAPSTGLTLEISASTGAIAVPSLVTVAPGQSSANFIVKAKPNALVTSSVVTAASHNASTQATVTIEPTARVINKTVSESF